MRRQRFDVLFFLYICFSIVIGNYNHFLLPVGFVIRASDMHRVLEVGGGGAGDAACNFLLEDFCWSVDDLTTL
jgi:hypothetical protein